MSKGHAYTQRKILIEAQGGSSSSMLQALTLAALGLAGAADVYEHRNKTDKVIENHTDLALP